MRRWRQESIIMTAVPRAPFHILPGSITICILQFQWFKTTRTSSPCSECRGLGTKALSVLFPHKLLIDSFVSCGRTVRLGSENTILVWTWETNLDTGTSLSLCSDGWGESKSKLKNCYEITRRSCSAEAASWSISFPRDTLPVLATAGGVRDELVGLWLSSYSDSFYHRSKCAWGFTYIMLHSTFTITVMTYAWAHRHWYSISPRMSQSWLLSCVWQFSIPTAQLSTFVSDVRIWENCKAG